MQCLVLLAAFVSVALAAGPSLVNVTVEWGTTTSVLATVPSLQVVAHSSLVRSSPIHDEVFQSLAALGNPRNVRYAPWNPYARQAVAELDPPTTGVSCTPMSWVFGQTDPVNLACGNSTIASVTFASYGTPKGICGAYTVNPTCHADVNLSRCVGKQSCWVDPTMFGDPCPGIPKYLAVEVACASPTTIVTYWNLTTPDAVFTDFWSAVDGDNSAPIVNFCTQPTWLYSPGDWSYPQQDNIPWGGYTRGTAPVPDLAALGDYYGRLMAWYTLGGFTDEAGTRHTSPNPVINVQIVEVFNEVDYEHGHTPQSYTIEYDAVVAGIRRWADPTKKIKFVGLSLPNIDGEALVETWATYFLNASNHAEGARDSLDYIGYHAYPTNGPYTRDPASFAQMFTYVDSFIETVAAVDAIINKLSPTTQTMLDETGTDMDNVLDRSKSPPDDNPYYWVASGSYFAYMYARAATLCNTTVRVVGQSQLMDAPGQEPSVTLLDWTTGRGTAKYWVLKLLLESFTINDVFAVTTTSSSDVYAQGFLAGTGGSRRILLVNKGYAAQSVQLVGDLPTCVASIVDVTTGLGPARVESCAPTGTFTLPGYATAIVQV